MKTTKSFLFGATVAFTLLVCVGKADAALLSLNGGTDIVTPGSNDVLGGGVALVDNAIPSTTRNNVKLTFYYWGSESGFDNTLNTFFGVHTETDNVTPGNGPVAFPGFDSPLFSGNLGSLTGSFAVSFSSTGFAGQLPAGAGDTSKSIAFAFMNADGSVSAIPTNMLLFALDDGGTAGGGVSIDDDHDDYVGYIVATPIPAAVWLFSSALLGLIAVSRWKKTG